MRAPCCQGCCSWWRPLSGAENASTRQAGLRNRREPSFAEASAPGCCATARCRPERVPKAPGQKKKLPH
jgi:hypothetical protein